MIMKNNALLLVILLSMVGLESLAYDFKVDGIYYNYDATTQSAIVTHADGETVYEREKYKGVIVIPETVTHNNRTMNVSTIGESAFAGCNELTSIVLPKSVSKLERYAFESCTALTSIDLNSIVEIKENVFSRCSALTRLVIPNTVKSISTGVFFGCINLKTFIIEDSQTPLSFSEGSSNMTFSDTNIKSLYIGRNILTEPSRIYLRLDSLTTLSIGKYVDELKFDIEDEFLFDWMPEYRATKCSVIYSLSESPNIMRIMRFPSNVYVNARLYVPIGAKDKYTNAEGWNNFFSIQEMDIDKMWIGEGEPNTDTSTNEKCATPTISYKNGKLTYSCDTEGAIFHSTIKDDDIKSYDSKEIQLGVIYNISVYATKEGYQTSETATATLCWIDVEPKTEGITDGVAQMGARAVMVKAEGGLITIEGAEDKTSISVYSIDGAQAGTTTSRNGIASIITTIPKDSVVIVKIGNKSVKVIMR